MGDERTCEHEWDLVVHGPGGSTFVCLRCSARKESQPAAEPSPVPSAPGGRAVRENIERMRELTAEVERLNAKIHPKGGS